MNEHLLPYDGIFDLVVANSSGRAKWWNPFIPSFKRFINLNIGGIDRLKNFRFLVDENIALVDPKNKCFGMLTGSSSSFGTKMTKQYGNLTEVKLKWPNKKMDSENY